MSIKFRILITGECAQARHQISEKVTKKLRANPKFIVTEFSDTISLLGAAFFYAQDICIKVLVSNTKITNPQFDLVVVTTSLHLHFVLCDCLRLLAEKVDQERIRLEEASKCVEMEYSCL